jgi:hypothetical protein
MDPPGATPTPAADPRSPYRRHRLASRLGPQNLAAGDCLLGCGAAGAIHAGFLGGGAHWHRVRLATRDAAGNIIGNRSGEQGVDWQYEMRWFPQTPVNVPVEGLPTPTIRDTAVEQEDRA